MKLRLDQIRANTWNCNLMGAKERETLKKCMMEEQPETAIPVVVRLMPDDGYELIDGEHRWTIAKELGWEEIEVFVREVTDDLQAKALCVGYNKTRGHLNWIKFYELICKDAADGVDIAEAYKDVLSGEEMKWLLSLGKLVPRARLELETALYRSVEIPLEQMYLIAMLPADQQDGIAELYKTSVLSHALIHTLIKAINHGSTSYANEVMPHLTEGVKNKVNALAEKPNRPVYPSGGDTDRLEMLLTKPGTSQMSGMQSKWSDRDGGGSWDGLGSSRFEERSTCDDGAVRVPRATLLTSCYSCDCGRHYQVNFRSPSVVMQKENSLFEHVDLKPRTFTTHCSGCNNDVEIAVKNTTDDTDDEDDIVSFSCSRCKPLRKGLLDVSTGKVNWLE